MRSPRLTVFDFGAERVACGTFRRGATGGLLCERWTEEPLRGHEADARAWAAEAAGAMAAIVARERIRGPVSLVLPGHLTRVRSVSTPAVGVAKRRAALAFEARESFPGAPHELVWDGVVVSDDGLDLRAVLAAAKREPVEMLCAVAEQVGCEVERVIPAALALVDGWRMLGGGEAGTHLLASIGARSTNVVLVAGERFGGRTLALGGQTVTERIARELRLDWVPAEALKRGVSLKEAARADEADVARVVQAARESFTTRLHLELARTIAHLRRQGEFEAPRTVWLTGGGAQLAGLAAGLAEKLGVSVKPYDGRPGVALSAAARAAGADAAGVSMAELAGVAAQALSGDAVGLNLRPERVAAAAVGRRRLRWGLAVAAVVALGMFVPLAREQARSERIAAERRTQEAELRPLRELAARIEADRVELEETQRRIAALQLPAAARTGWADFLRDLQERLVAVEDAWLEKMEWVGSGEVSAVANREGESAARRLTLSGCLLDVANPQSRVSRESEVRAQRLLRSFAASPFVAAVEEERFDDRQHGVLRFDVTLVLRADCPL